MVLRPRPSDPALIVLFLMGLTIAVARPVGASAESQDETQPGQRQASDHFRHAEELFDAGDYTEAAQEFIGAYEIEPHRSVAINIALSFDKAGNYPQAVRWYRRCLEDSPGPKGNDNIRARLRELEALVGELNVTCALVDCQVRVDYVNEGAAPLSALVLPGPHYVEAMVKGRPIAAIRVSAVTGKTVNVELAVAGPRPEDAQEPGAVGPPRTSTQEETLAKGESLASTGKSHRAGGVALMALGGGALLAGVVTGLVGFSQYEDLTKECSELFGDEVCPPGYRTASRDKIEATFLAGDILLGAGLVVAASGALLYWLAPRSKPDESADAVPLVSWFAVPSPDGAFVGLKVAL